MLRSLFVLVSTALILESAAWAQDNYEIQVYGSKLVQPDTTMVELHSNYTISGSTEVSNGVLPTQHALHETLEITHGWNEYFETGFYQFTSIQSDGSLNWVGTHFRPRFAVPERLDWPVGLSLSVEVGYQRPQFSEDTWTVEIRPIIDKRFDRWYLSFNPTLELSLAGLNKSRGLVFSPNFKISYDASPTVTVGLEYYGSLGRLAGFDPLSNQQHAICPCIDLNLDPDFEFNFGVVIGLTPNDDQLIPKMYMGRRFGM